MSDAVADKTYDVLLPDPDPKGAAAGYRLHLYREPHENLLLAEERVLPEKVADPNAHRVMESTRIWLKRDEVRWLRDRLDEVLARYDAEDAEPTPTRCANPLHGRDQDIPAPPAQCPDCQAWEGMTAAQAFDEVTRG